jgi:hypothetical protein
MTSDVVKRRENLPLHLPYFTYVAVLKTLTLSFFFSFHVLQVLRSCQCIANIVLLTGLFHTAMVIANFDAGIGIDFHFYMILASPLPCEM